MRTKQFVRVLIATSITITGSLPPGWSDPTDRVPAPAVTNAAIVHALVRRCGVGCPSSGDAAGHAATPMFPRRSDGITRLVLSQARTISETSAPFADTRTAARDR